MLARVPASIVVLSLVDWANVVAGAAGAIALVFTVWAFTRQLQQEARAQADKVIAWAVYVADDQGQESEDLGVVVVNASSEVALDVDVKTCAAQEGVGFADDGVPGRRFALVPPGTYFLPQSGTRWDAPVPVDTSDGRFTTTVRDESGGAPATLTLVPVTRRPEPKRVRFLRYRIGDRTWYRDADSRLRKGADAPADWDEQFELSQSQPLAQHSVKPHQANASVGGLVEALFLRFAVPGSASGPGARAEVRPEFAARGVTWVARTTRNGQGLRLGLSEEPDGQHLYVSGDHTGTVPNAGIQLTARVGASGRRLPKALQPEPRDAAYWSGHLDELVRALENAVAAQRQAAADSLG